MMIRLTILFLGLIISVYSNAQSVFDAARSGDIERLEVLYLEFPDTLDVTDENGFTPLILATYRNQVEAVEYLLDHGVNTDYLSQEGTALHAACYKGSIKIAKLLILKFKHQSIFCLSSLNRFCNLCL